MSEDRKADHQGLPIHSVAANDDCATASPQSDDVQPPPDFSNRRQFPRIVTDWPERLPVIQAESDLIVAYLSDLIGGIIANDNIEG